MPGYRLHPFDSANAARRGHFLINLLYFVTWAALLLLATWLAAKWLMPFVLAFATAALLQRPVHRLTKFTRAPTGFLSGALVVFLVLLLAAAVGGLGFWLFRTFVNVLSNDAAITAVIRTLTDTVQALEQQLTQWGARLSPATQSALSAAFGNVLGQTEEWLGHSVAAAARAVLQFAVTRLPSLLLGFLIWVIASVFFTVDYKRITAFITRQLPPHRRKLAADIRRLCGNSLAGLARAYLLLMLLTFAQLAVGLWLIGVKNALLTAAIIAVVDVLPILGVATVLIPWAGIAFLNGTPQLGLCLLILCLAVTIIRNIAEPRLVGERVGLPPLVSLLSVYLGWQVAGLWGVLLLPLAVTVLTELQKAGDLPLWK